MSWDGPNRSIPGLEAGADLSSYQYHFGKLDASGDVVACDTQGEEGLGVIYNKPSAAGRAVDFKFDGVVTVEAGEAISIDDNITPGADAKAETALTGDYIVGLALTAASAAGEMVTVLLRTGARTAA